MASFKLGAFTTLIGMGGTFLVLIVLAIITIFMGKLIDSRNKQKQATVTVVSEPVNECMPLGDAVVETGISPRTVAAIMAAVTAAGDGTALKFHAIRRTGRINNSWTNASNLDIINNRQQYL
ncbi:MAG: OadG family protein [Clostridiales bacterium]